MRYSRMLEESSFANKKADYFWLLLLSSIMLLVSSQGNFQTHRLNISLSFEGPLTSLQPALPVLLARICPYLPMVTTASINTHLAIWLDNDISALSPHRPRRLFLGTQRLLQGCSK